LRDHLGQQPPEQDWRRFPGLLEAAVRGLREAVGLTHQSVHIGVGGVSVERKRQRMCSTRLTRVSGDEQPVWVAERDRRAARRRLDVFAHALNQPQRGVAVDVKQGELDVAVADGVGHGGQLHTASALEDVDHQALQARALLGGIPVDALLEQARQVSLVILVGVDRGRAPGEQKIAILANGDRGAKALATAALLGVEHIGSSDAKYQLTDTGRVVQDEWDVARLGVKREADRVCALLQLALRAAQDVNSHLAQLRAQAETLGPEHSLAVCLLHETPITIAGVARLSLDELAEAHSAERSESSANNYDYSHAGSANTGVGYWWPN
jgi:hypothetical protein